MNPLWFFMELLLAWSCQDSPLDCVRSLRG
jgi:hypothetical protein